MNNATGLGSTYIGKFTTIKLSGTINGVVQDWIGELTMILVGPNTNITHTVNITSDWEYDLNFTPDSEGEFEIFMHITGIPLGMPYNDSMNFSVGSVPLEIMLDTGTTPILGGGGVLFVLGLLVRRRLNGSLDMLLGEWE